MSVIVKNMEMPKNCQECPFIHSSWGFDFYCGLAKDYQDFAFTNSHRMPSCPLIELPPHGRLIDADKLANETFYGATSAPYITYWKFVNAPTVIEAEGSET